MFESFAFAAHLLRMRSNAEAASVADEQGDPTRALQCLKTAIEEGHAALALESPFISVHRRALVGIEIKEYEGAYQKEIIKVIPDGDREIILSMINAWTQLGTATFNVHALSLLIVMLDRARDRVDGRKDLLERYYVQDNAVSPLCDIMRPFVTGEANRRETIERIDHSIDRLRAWMPELFPGQTVHI